MDWLGLAVQTTFPNLWESELMSAFKSAALAYRQLDKITARERRIVVIEKLV